MTSANFFSIRFLIDSKFVADSSAAMEIFVIFFNLPIASKFLQSKGCST